MEKGRKHTLIIVKRIMAEQNMAIAGVMVESSFARFIALMASFNKERARS